MTKKLQDHSTATHRIAEAPLPHRPDLTAQSSAAGNQFARVCIVAICTLVMMVDTYDLSLVGLVLPDLAKFFGLKPTALTPILQVQQLGAVLGGFLIAPLGDRIGRRNLLALCLSGIAVGSMAARSSTLVEFAVWRVFTCVFVGAIMSTTIAYLSEIAPRHLRARLPTIAFAGAMAGPVVGSVMQAYILERFGWQGGVVLGGVLPLILAPLVMIMLPESPRFLAARNPSDPRIARNRAILGSWAEVSAADGPAGKTEGSNGATSRKALADILGPGQRVSTLLLWGSFVASYVYLSVWTSWSTTVFHNVLNISWQRIAAINLVFGIGSVVGTLIIGIAIDRFGFRRVLPPALSIGFIATAGVGMVAPGPALPVLVGAMSLFALAGQGGMSVMVPTFYRAEYRSTGVGWAYGAGRFGSIIGPALGSALLLSHIATPFVFAAFGFPLLVAAGLIALLLALRKTGADGRA